MARLKEIRGAGVRFTLPYLFRFSGLWLVVTVAAMVVSGVACYFMASPRLDVEARSRLALVLAAQTVFLVLAVVALAIFTTHRLAGPYIALRRAFEEVKNGELDRPLRLRGASHLKELETTFNEMKAALRKRLGSEPVATGPA